MHNPVLTTRPFTSEEVIRLVVSLVFFALSALTLAAYMYDNFHDRESRNWPIVEGTVINSEIITHTLQGMKSYTLMAAGIPSVQIGCIFDEMGLVQEKHGSRRPPRRGQFVYTKPAAGLYPLDSSLLPWKPLCYRACRILSQVYLTSKERENRLPGPG